MGAPVDRPWKNGGRCDTSPLEVSEGDPNEPRNRGFFGIP